jgi:superfamily II DNA or RNA helicase
MAIQTLILPLIE